jgi:hypothetical protein
MKALSQDFRRWLRNRDFRKFDAVGIGASESIAPIGELLEVTTAGNAQSAITQMRDKLDTLNTTVNRVWNLTVQWRGALWRPQGLDNFYPLPATTGRLRYLCYEPTTRLNPPQGVILYEVHEVTRPPVPVPIPVPQEEQQKIRQQARDRTLTPQTAEAWARQVARDHPILLGALRALAAVAGVALAVAAVVALIDPVPGDEVAAGSAALWLLRFAQVGLSAA